LLASFAQGLFPKKADAPRNRGQRVAQIVAEYGNELFADRRCVLLVEEVLDGAELEADHLRKHFEHLNGFGGVQPRRFRIDCAWRSEKRSIGEPERHRDVALQTIGLRSVVAGIKQVLGHMVYGLRDSSKGVR
jgi:hypothetical protein